MDVVVDTSVAIKWFVAEDDSAAALALRTEYDCAAPDLLLVECRNVLLTKVRRGELSIDQARLVEEEIEDAHLDIIPSAPLLPRAFAIGLSIGAPIYDCVYLAAAIAIDRKLVTADERFVAKLRKSRFEKERVTLLA